VHISLVNVSRTRQPVFLGLFLAFISLFFMATAQAGGTSSSAADSRGAPYDVLADLLENDEARQQLIDDLRNRSESSPSRDEMTANQTTSEVTDETDSRTFARQVADNTQQVAQELVTTLTESFQIITAIGSGDAARDWGAIASELTQLLLVIAATLVVFFTMRRIAKQLFAKANYWAEADSRHPIVRRTVAILGSTVIDLVVVALAWVAGYALALFAVGDGGEMYVSQSLFLNAFLVIEVFKVLLRAVFSVHDPALRPIKMADDTAIYWYSWLSRITNFIGYGILVLVPLVNTLLSAAIGQLLNVLIIIFVVTYGIVVISHKRKDVREKLQARAFESDFSFARVGLGMLARSWHILAIIYFLVMAGALLLEPEKALPLMLLATVQTLIAIAIGMMLMTALNIYLGHRVKIPEETKAQYPLLEERLNGFVPKVFKTLRIVIVVTVIAVILDAWHVFNLKEWIASPAGIGFIATVLTVAAILLTSTLIWIGLASWIEHRLNPLDTQMAPTAREKTLLTIFRNAVAITLIVLTLMIVLAEIGINIGPLIAGAGVLGLAIGFGAQKLVQDVITGVFIQMENAINVGDIVTASGVTGVAEKLTIRSLGLRDLSGTFHMIPFSAVDNVSNFSREFGYHVGEYGVAYRENTDEVIVKLREAFDELIADPDQRNNILSDELEVHGVTALADSSVNIRVRIKTLPGVQFGVGRAYNRLVKQHLDKAGIEIPFPHLTLYFGEDQKGQAPAAPIRIIESEKAKEPEKDKEPEQDKEAPSKVTKKRSRSNPKGKLDFDDGDTR